MIPPHRAAAAAMAGLLATLSMSATLTACSSDSAEGDGGPDGSAADVLAEAKERLDDTSGINLTLSADHLPDGVTGVEKAQGVATHAPAFDGSITVVIAGQSVEVPVVAVDDTVYAQLPFTSGFQDIDPGEYGAPDPAQLMSPDHGLSSLLTSTTDLEKGDSVRGGEGNKEVLTEYTGTVSGDVVQHILPTASGEFDATYTVTDDGELRSAVLTGVFYEDSDPMTYTVDFDDYGTDKDITAP